MRLLSIDYILWWCTPVLMLAVAVSMYRRGLHREFPYFFNYVILQVISFAVEFPLRNSPSHYWVSWTTTALSVAVSFAVLLEIFKDAFRPYEALRDLSTILFRWCALVVLLVAGMWAVTSWRTNDVDNITNGILLVGRCVRMMQCGLVFFLLLFSEYLGIAKHNAVFGISIGFGFYAATNMLVMTALTHHTVLSKPVLNAVNSGAYVAAMLIWLAYTALPSTSRAGAKQKAVASQRWDEALDDVRNATPAVSVLDTMDDTVERLLYHQRPAADLTAGSRR